MVVEMESFTRGDLVWARVVYPHQWSPGLVLKIDPLGVLVSLFGYQNSRYFLESEISSFEQNFTTHIKNCENRTLLERAFKFLGQQVVLSLTCPGQVRKQGSGPSNLFQPQRVLGFVRGVAVRPWVEDGDFVSAVKVFAQTTAFRHYLVNSSVHSRMQADQDSFDNMHSVAGKLDGLRMVDDCPAFSEQVEKNLSACLINRKNMGNSFSTRSLRPCDEDQLDKMSITQIKQQKTQSLPEMLANLQFLALDSLCLDGDCLITLKRSILIFRNLSFQSVSDHLFSLRLSTTIPETCSPLERAEAQFSNPSYTMSQLGVNVNGEKEKTSLPLIHYMESPIKCLGLKRQLDQSLFSEHPLKLRKILSFSINRADALWRSRRECGAVLSDIFNSGNALPRIYKFFNAMPFSSNRAYDYLRRNITGCEAELFEYLSSGSRLKMKTQNLSSVAAESSTYMCSSSLMDLVQHMLNFSLVKHKFCCSDNVETCVVQKLDENVNALNNNETYKSSANIQQPQESEAILIDDGSCISYTHEATENMVELSAAQSVSDHAVGIIDHDKAGDVTTGTRTYQSHSHFTSDELKMLLSNSDNSTCIKISRELSENVPFVDRFKENKKLSQLVTSDLAFKSKVRELSEVQTTTALSKTLHMKFPKDYSLPSKEELVKKFSPFGRVDHLRTKVYFYTGSAQVVFLHQLDAMAAYQYAKRKKIVFGKQNVKFWLDPFDDKRGSKNLARSPEFNLKSCLKKSKSLEKEDKKGPRKVRFLMET